MDLSVGNFVTAQMEKEPDEITKKTDRANDGKAYSDVYRDSLSLASGTASFHDDTMVPISCAAINCNLPAAAPTFHMEHKKVERRPNMNIVYIVYITKEIFKVECHCSITVDDAREPNINTVECHYNIIDEKTPKEERVIKNMIANTSQDLETKPTDNNTNVLKTRYVSGVGRLLFSTTRSAEQTDENTFMMMKYWWQHRQRAGNWTTSCREPPQDSRNKTTLRVHITNAQKISLSQRRRWMRGTPNGKSCCATVTKCARRWRWVWRTSKAISDSEKSFQTTNGENVTPVCKDLRIPITNWIHEFSTAQTCSKQHMCQSVLWPLWRPVLSS